jgi:type II/III secretion system protein
VTKDQTNQNFKGTAITFDIMGNVGIAGVLLEGLPGRPMSGPDGSYSVKVPYRWKGTVTPKKQGYTFEPASTEYSELTLPEPSQDYAARVVQFTITGRIVTEEGPAANVFILADNDGGSATTDANGEYELSVDYKWRGKITPQQDGYTFTPASRLVQPVMQNIPNVGFAGRIQMVSITNAIILDDGEPIQGVTVTADPGGYRAVSDAKGKYTVRVPYGWSGGLSFEKEGWDIDGSAEVFDNVIEDIDKSAPPAPPVENRTVSSLRPDNRGEVISPQPDNEGEVISPQPDPSLDAERDATLERMRQMQEEIDRMRDGTVPPDQFPSVTLDDPPTTRGPSLIDILKQLSADMNVQIGVDVTVKPIPVSLNFDPTTVPVPVALTRILEPIGHMYKEVDGKYLVFKPINNGFQGDDLRQVLADIGADAGVTIVPDPNVGGEVFAELNNVSLETALKIVLAGSPFVVHATPDYFVVVDRSVENPGIFEVLETRHVYLNYTTPQTALQLLSSAYAPYVKVDADPNSHIISITADPELAAQIAEVVKRLDTRPRHVLLDARVVAMEHSDLLDVGVEWDFGTVNAGFFDNDISARGWGLQLGYTSDRTFTDSLLMALNLLQKDEKAEIVSNTQVTAQDGNLSEFGVLTEEYYMLTPPVTNNALFYSQTEMVTIISGTKLSITPRIGDNGDITLYMATEVSNSNPAAAATALPVVTRRTARNVVTLKNGGTAALAGLTENRNEVTDTKVPFFGDLPVLGGLFKNKANDESTREIAIFVTATLVDEAGQAIAGPAPQAAARLGYPVQPQGVPQGFTSQPQFAPQGFAVQPQPTRNTFQDGIEAALSQ